MAEACADEDSCELDDLDDNDSGGWEECDDDETSAKVDHVCLFCDKKFPDALTTFAHCGSEHHVDISRLKRLHRLDCIGYIKLVNFIRRTNPETEVLFHVCSPGSAPWDSDDYMMPVIADDMMLQFDIEEMDDGALSSSVQSSVQSSVPSGDASCASDQSSLLMSLSVNEFVTLTSRLNAAEQRAACATDALQNALADIEKMRSWASETLLTSATVKLPADECPCASEDRSYFESYGHYSIHEEMLKDRVRTNSYRDAIFNNREMFRDKVVLDVGCGTGILCMFAASAGAKLVIGVDQSDIIYQAMDIVRENGFKDSITLLKGKMEEVELPVDKVDIIISEWMGYFLLYESMLDTVLWARDHYLAPGGHIMPDLCHLYIAGVSDVDTYQKRYAFWDDVYGFRMTCMKSAVTAEADVTIVDASKVVTESCLVKEISVATCKTTDLEFSCKLTLVAKSSGQLTAVVGFFDIEFCALDTKVSFSTSPSAIPTHWKQTVFLLEKPITVTAGDTLTGNLQCRKNRSDPRSLRITLTIDGHLTATYIMQ